LIDILIGSCKECGLGGCRLNLFLSVAGSTREFLKIELILQNVITGSVLTRILMSLFAVSE